MKLEEITSHINPEEGWKDIFLGIVEVTEKEDSFVFIGKGTFNDIKVGFRVETIKGMHAGLLPSNVVNQDAFYRNGIRFLSLGLESDELIKALSEMYQFPTNNPFAQIIDGIMVFSLNQIDVDFSQKEYYKFKLFFNDESDISYCEMYCNIDLANGLIELHEKDEEYRENLIKTFTKQL